MGNVFSLFGAKKTIKTTHVNTTAYTKEFTYLPSYHWVQATEYTPATDKEPFAQAKYLIHNVSDTQVFDSYQAILINDGWTITEETRVITFSAKKDIHLANISITSTNEGIMLIVQSK